MKYRISHTERKYSTTPIVEIIENESKETEKIVCVCTGSKSEAEKMSNKIVDILNEQETVRDVLIKYMQNKEDKDAPFVIIDEREFYASDVLNDPELQDYFVKNILRLSIDLLSRGQKILK